MAAVLAAAALPAVASACSASTSSSSTTQRTKTTTSAPPSEASREAAVCSLVTPAEINEFMGVTVRPGSPVVRGLTTTCNYKGPDVAQSVIIQYQGDATASSFDADKAKLTAKYGTTSPVDDLGNQAYSTTTSTGQQTVNTVAVLVGELQLVVIGTSSLSKVETMASFVLYKLESGASSSTTSTTSTTSAT